MIFRPSYIVGSGDELLPNLVNSILQGRVFVAGEGNTPMQPIFVQDATTAFLGAVMGLGEENSVFFKETNLPEGYIPTRNLVFYALATYYAEIFGSNYIIGGHLETDSIGFPDATPKFFVSLERLVNDSRPNSGSKAPREIKLLMPFLEKSKTDVLKTAMELKVPLELTWSCYYDEDKPCKKCVTCLERADAFSRVGLKDPLM